jgi:hypothetical protein
MSTILTIGQREWIKDNAATHNKNQIARYLGVRYKVVARYMAKHNIPHLVSKAHSHTTVRVVWTEEETKALRELAGTMPVADIAAKIGRTVGGIRSHARINKIWLGFKRKRWTKEEDQELMVAVESLPVKRIAKAINKSVNATRNRMFRKKFRSLCGVYALNEIMRETGYQLCQLRRAKEALNQKWTMLKWGKRGRYAIEHCQMEALTNWLRDEGKEETLQKTG